MRTLYLLRHAKAEPGNAAQGDAERALAPRGRLAADAMGAYMLAKGYVPDLALCSSAARTVETLTRVSEAGGFAPVVEQVGKLYLATAGEMLAVLQNAGDVHTKLLLVGHNPGMHHLASLLAFPDKTPLRMRLELKYPTTALAVLRFDAAHWRDIQSGTGALRDFVTPQAEE